MAVLYETYAPPQMIVDSLDPDRLAAFGSRILAALEIRENEHDARPNAVLLGLSTMREGVDVHQIQDALPDCRWMNLGASGGSFFQLEYYSEALLHSPLAPRLVVLGIHAEWLSNPDARVQSQRTENGSAGVFQALDVYWSWRARNTFGNLIRYEADAARRTLAERFRWAFPVLFPPGRHLNYEGDGRPTPDDPWNAPHKYDGLHADAERLAFLQKHAERFGWFNASAYDSSGSESGHLVSLLRRIEATGATVVVVLMPENTSLRNAVPTEAFTTMGEALEASGVKVALIDHRALVDDALFYDHAHLNYEGRKFYGERLSEALKPYVARLR